MKYIPLEKTDTGRGGYQQKVKEANIKRIFDLVRFGKCKSRAEIVRNMDLSATSVSVLVEELAARGLVAEVGPTQTSLPGRRPISLRLNSEAHQIVVFALSRHGVRYTLLNLDCEVLESRTAALETDGMTGEEAAAAFIRLFDQLLKRRSRLYDPRRALVIGISVPGLYLNSCGLFYNRTALGVSLPEGPFVEYQRRVGLPLYMLNDTRCMAYAEKRFLDAADPEAPEVENLIYMNINKSLSCAVITRGDLYAGPFNIAGQIGHTTIDFNGRPCHCGSRGCLARYVNRDAILEDAQQAAAAAGVQPPESLEALAQRCADEPALRDALRSSARMLAAGLYSAMCGTGLRRIVITGVECLGEAFLEMVREALLERSLLVRTLDLSYAQAGPDAQALGLAQHYLDKVFTVTG